MREKATPSIVLREFRRSGLKDAAAVFAISVSVSLLKPATPTAPTTSPLTRIGTLAAQRHDAGGDECRSAMINVVLDLCCWPL